VTRRKPEAAPADAASTEANDVRPDILTIGDDMPIEVRVRLDCARIAVKAAAHIGLDGIVELAARIESYVLMGDIAAKPHD
jgi:hypothetical protein